MTRGRDETRKPSKPPRKRAAHLRLVVDRTKAANTQTDPGVTARASDVGNAEALVERFGDELRFVDEWALWLVWDGRRWVLDRSGARAYRFAVLTARELLKDAIDAKSAYEKKWATQSQTAGRLGAMLEVARTDPSVHVSFRDLDADPMLLNVGNGTIDLKTGRKREHRRSDLITRLAPVVFDPKAKAPRWDKFLKQITADNADTQSFLRRWLGYCLTGSVQEQALLVHYGNGGRGKSTLVNTIHRMLGDYACKAPRKFLFTSKTEQHPTELATLYGRRFVTTSEVGKQQTFDEEKTKDLTGDDPIPARRMRENFWEFLPTFKLNMPTNYKPRVVGTDDGIWRRIRLFCWNVPIVKRDKGLPAKLRAEASGILADCVRGSVEWHETGLGEPAEITAATEEYRAESDRLGEFFRLRCGISPNARVSRKTLRTAYERYAEENGEKFLVSPRDFTSAVRAKDGVTEKAVRESGHVRDGWRGIGLLTDAEREARTVVPTKRRSMDAKGRKNKEIA